MKKIIKIIAILGSVISISYIIYKKIMDYITLDEESENVFESLKTHNNVPDNLLLSL